MTDDLTPREITREFDRIAEQQRAQDTRLAELAAGTAPFREITELRTELGRVEAELKADIRDIKGELRREADAVEGRSLDRFNRATRAVEGLGARTDERFKELGSRTDERFKELQGQKQFTRQQVVAIIAVIVPLAIALISIIFASHGIKV